MFIIKERYLEVPNFQNWTEGLYLVDAPCGTGKSYFVFHTLYPFAKENNKKLIVFSNRNALKRQQELQAEGTDIELITYQKLEYNQYLNGDWNVRRSVPDLMQELERYDYIVLDEAHYLFQDARFNRNTEVEPLKIEFKEAEITKRTDTKSNIPEYTIISDSKEGSAQITATIDDGVSASITVNVERKTRKASSYTHSSKSVSQEYQNALTKGLQYANQLHMSKQAIYDQLTSSYGEGFPADAAQYAVDNMTGVDWNANALEKAKQYYYDMAMSKSAVYDQLTSSYGEQFTASQAQYAIDHLD